MKAAVCYELGKPLVIEDINIDPPQKGEVKVKLSATAICHSDIHALAGELPGKTPVVGGHESAGYVEEVGEGVTKVKLKRFLQLTGVLSLPFPQTPPSRFCFHLLLPLLQLRHGQ